MSNKKAAGITLLVCLGGLLAASIYCGGWEPKKSSKKVQSEPRVIKIKEVVGQVVGGPQIVTGSPLIGFVVYIKELKSYGALHAEQCPQWLENGQQVVMYQKDTLGNWYTFLRFAK